LDYISKIRNAIVPDERSDGLSFLAFRRLHEIGDLCVAEKKVFFAEFFNEVLKPGALGVVH